MRLIVLDTNVIVSAGIAADGPPAKIVESFVLTGKIHTVTIPRVEAEYREVTRRAKFHQPGFSPLWLEFVIEESMRLPDQESWSGSCPDPDDTPFIALTHAAGAWLVTGNLRHFPEAIRNGVTVVSPAYFLAHLTAE